MLITRLISAFAFFALFGVGLFAPGFDAILVFLFAGGALLGIYECMQLGVKRPSLPFTAVAQLGALMLLADAYLTGLQHALLILGLVTVAAIALGLFLNREHGSDLAGKCLVSLIYVGLPFALIMDIWRGAGLAAPYDGPFYIIFLVLTTWASDVGAYFVGRWLGRTKMAPRLSPGKTWEGFAGGIAFTLAGVTAIKLAWPAMDRLFGWGEILVLGLLFSILGPIGDLAESQLKRSAGAKDSGVTYTGHGGLLDIVDSLLFTTVFYYGYLWWFHPDLL